MTIEKVEYSIVYNTKDISRDLSPQILSINYTDKIGGESDTCEITFEDADKRWQNEWYPAKGDSIELTIRQNGQQLRCGTFEVDEIACAIGNGGDIFTIRGIAAGIKKQLRTKKTYAHEDKTLREIANTVASEMGLTIIGTVPTIRLHREHQYQETPLAFLNRVGDDHGCVFSVRGKDLIFTFYKDLVDRKPSLVLYREDLISSEFRDTTNKTFKKCRVKHHDPVSKEVQEYVANYDNEGETSNDDLELRVRAENKSQAESKAKYALFKNNTSGVGGDISLPGSMLFISGNNFQLNGTGKFSGIYHILESSHSISRTGGYTTGGNIKRIKAVDPSNFKLQKP